MDRSREKKCLKESLKKMDNSVFLGREILLISLGYAL